MNPVIWSIILSILPISELRGGMIYAILSGVSPLKAFLICTIANILAIFFVFFFLDFLHSSFMKIKAYRNFFDFYLEKIRKKVNVFEKHYSSSGFIALFIFVAIPLPGTGGWTGALIAWLLGLDRRKSLLAIVLGILAAGLILLLASLGIIGVVKLV
ncbi:MAG: small multi-drug export protein [Candidatus Pacearchaeota archaeon]|nr:small multi-drug export protein [Candidatus Pacearchaeota archaeon]